MVLDAEETLEESSSAVTASGSQLQQAGQSEAPEEDPCPICLGEVKNTACVSLCFHHFCFGCIQRWAATKAVCPLCRRPFDRVLRVLPDDEKEEDQAGFPACLQRNVARERSRSRSPQRRYVLARPAMNNRVPARRRRRHVGSDRASRGDGAPVPASTTSQQTPVPSASWARAPPSTGVRVVSPGDGAYVHIGTLALPPLHIQLSFWRDQ